MLLVLTGIKLSGLLFYVLIFNCQELNTVC